MENGMFPFFVSTTLGTTGCVAFDNLDEIGEQFKLQFKAQFKLQLKIEPSFDFNVFIRSDILNGFLKTNEFVGVYCPMKED